MFFNIRNMKDIADILVTLDANDNSVRNFRYDEKDLYPNDENFYEIMLSKQNPTDGIDNLIS